MAEAALEPVSCGDVEVAGRRVFWERFGDGRRPCVALLNGLAMHTRAWAPFLPLLLDEYDVLLHDYPGQGRSCCADLPVTMPQLAAGLDAVADAAGLDRFHAMGISYGGFVALEYARLHHPRLLTLTVSGILLSHEELFEMYEDLSLRFYRGDDAVFELYTHYMYEKIFGEPFVRQVRERLPEMRQRFFDRYRDLKHCLIRLTEAQDPFFAALDENLSGYRAIATPTLILAGADDRAIPAEVQRKITGILPQTRFELVPETGHVVYLERPTLFFGMLKRFAARQALDF